MKIQAERVIWGALNREFGSDLRPYGSSIRISFEGMVYEIQWVSVQCRLAAHEQAMGDAPGGLRSRLDRAFNDALPRQCRWVEKSFIISPIDELDHQVVVIRLRA